MEDYVPGTCGACGEPIIGDHIAAFMMQWHLDHLLCNICGKDFSDGTQVCEGIDGFAYCPEDWQKVRFSEDARLLPSSPFRSSFPRYSIVCAIISLAPCFFFLPC